MRGFDSHYPLHRNIVVTRIRRRSQVVRQGSAKAPFGSSNLPVASKVFSVPAMRVAVVGAGAIGGFLAAALARPARRWPSSRAAHISRPSAARPARSKATSAHLPRTSTAGDDLRDAGRVRRRSCSHSKRISGPALLPQLAALAANRRRPIVTLQNGLPFWYVREPPLQSVDPDGQHRPRLFRTNAIIGGVVHVSGTSSNPASSRRAAACDTSWAIRRCGQTRAPANCSSIMSGSGPSRRSRCRTIRATVWLKLVNNVGLNSVSALAAHDDSADAGTIRKRAPRCDV